MKKVIVIHRWEGTPQSDWYPWLRTEIEKKGFEVTVPLMPNTEEPKINEWVSTIKNLIKNPNQDICKQHRTPEVREV